MRSRQDCDVLEALNLDTLLDEASRIAAKLERRATALRELLSRCRRLMGDILPTMVEEEIHLCEKYLTRVEDARSAEQARGLAIVLDDACWFFNLDGPCTRFKHRMLESVAKGSIKARVTSPQTLEFFREAVLPLFDRQSSIGKQECLRRLRQFRDVVLMWDGQNRPPIKQLVKELAVKEDFFHQVWACKKGRCNDAPCNS